ncbi:MAG: HisA/HisF-related TIM barrel protein [Pseudomonadota bacterium]
MNIIPVIDLLDGKVVHAKRGEREHYQVIESRLTHSSDPNAIVNAYSNLFPFKQIYIADLNAIQATGDNIELIKTLLKQFPEYEFWVDAGLSFIDELITLQQTENIRLVIGTESNPSMNLLMSLHKDDVDWILSLDFLSDDMVIGQEILESQQYWPQTLIIMMLKRVGTENGINEKTVSSINTYVDDFKVYAAGGISNKSDLDSLKKQGCDGALIATALHNGKIDSIQLQSLAS